MIHAPVLPPPTDYKLLKIVLDDGENNLKIADRDVSISPPVPTKKATPQQLLAAMAFRLTGIDVSFPYNTSKAFMWPADNLPPIATEAFKNDTGAISHAAHALRVFAHKNDVDKHGQVQKNNVADYTSELTTATQEEEVISFSKILGNKEIIIVHNTSETEAKEKFILLNNNINCTRKSLTAVYGYDTCGQVHLFHGKQGGDNISYIKIYLKPSHIIILKNY